MTDAITEIKDTYSYEDAKEIVNYGYGYVGCGPHILYDNAIEFFTKYPDEITRELVSQHGVDFLSDILKRRDGDLDMYMTDLTFAFIELVCLDIIAEYESTTQEELNYSDELQYTMFGRTLNDQRYAMI